MPEMDRRSMMVMTGLGMLAAAVRVPEAHAYPPAPQAPPGRTPAPDAPATGAASGGYVFSDEFDGPAGSGPDLAKWTVWNHDENSDPPVEGHYVARNVFLDGNSNLVIRANQEEDDDFYTGKLQSTWRGGIGHTWEARIKFDCLTPGCWPAYWTVNEDPRPDGEVDIVEWYGNGDWPPGTTVHGRSDGRTWEGKSIPELVDPGWHTWRMRWDEAGFAFWRDYVDGAQPYLTVKPDAIKVYPFNQPGYLMSVVFNLAIGGPGGGNPNDGDYPAAMLVDYVRVW
jgi:beta-glucanase (GH16 family)